MFWGTALELVAALLSITYTLIDALMLFSTAFALSNVYGFTTHAVRALIPLYGLFILRETSEHFKKAFWLRVLSAAITYTLLLNTRLHLSLPNIPSHIISAVITFALLFFIYRGIAQVANDNNMHALSKRIKRFYLPRSFFQVYSALPYTLIMLFVAYMAVATGASVWESMLPNPFIVSSFVDIFMIMLPLMLVLAYELYLLRCTYKALSAAPAGV